MAKVPKGWEIVEEQIPDGWEDVPAEGGTAGFTPPTHYRKPMELQSAHAPVSVNYDPPMTPQERTGRTVLTGAGAGLGGVLASPGSMGLAMLPGAMVGGSIGKYAGDVVYGERKPENQLPPHSTSIDAQEIEPTKVGAVLRGVSNQNLAQSVPRFVEGMTTFPYHIAKGVGEPALRGDMETAGQGAVEIAKGMVAPIGLAGDEAFRQAWQMDAPGSLLMAAGGAKAATYPAKAAGTLALKGINKMGPLSSERMMARHLKQGTTVKNRTQNVETALEGGYTASKKGLDKLYDDIDSVNQGISMVIDDAKTQGKTVRVDDILKPLQEMRQRAMDDPIDFAEIAKELDNIEANVRSHPNAVDGKIPVDVAQRMKIEMYRNLRKQYGEMKGTVIEAKKGLARGIKEALVEQIPELKELNAKDSLLIGLEKELFRAANRIGNRDLLGIGVPIKLIAMSHKGPVALALGAMLGMMDTPAVQGRLAIMLRRARNRPLVPGELKAFVAMLKERGQKTLAEEKEVLERGMVPVPDPRTGTERVAPVNELPSGPTIEMGLDRRALPAPVMEVTPEGQAFSRDRMRQMGNADKDLGMMEQRPGTAQEPGGIPMPIDRGVGAGEPGQSLRQGLPSPEQAAIQVSPEGTAFRRDLSLPKAPDVGLLEQNASAVATMLRDRVKVNGGGKVGAAKTAAEFGIPAAVLTSYMLADDEDRNALLAAMPLAFFSQARKAMEKAPAEFKGTPDVQLQGQPAKTIRNPKTGEVIKEIPAQEGKVVPGKSADVVLDEYLKANNVKTDEIADLGLREWAQAKAAKGEPLTKKDITEFIDNNGWEVKDVVLGKQKGEDTQARRQLEKLISDNNNLGYSSTEAAYRLFVRGKIQPGDIPWKSPGDVHLAHKLRDQLKEEVLPTHYSRYTEPGGKDYVELFVTAEKPVRGQEVNLVEIRDNLVADRRNMTSQEYQQALAEYNRIATEQKIARDASPRWKDGHVSYDDITNPVVRLRMKTREMDGKNTLFIEEMQGPVEDQQSKMPESLRKRIYDIGTKRALAYAKENGYDQVAWTTGDMQVKRYEGALRQVVDEILYDTNTNTMTAKRNGMVVQSKKVSPDKLSDEIGVEASKKLLESRDEANTQYSVFDKSSGEVQLFNSKKDADEYIFNTAKPEFLDYNEAREALVSKRPDLLDKVTSIAGDDWDMGFVTYQFPKGKVVRQKLFHGLTTVEFETINDILSRFAGEKYFETDLHSGKRIAGEDITIDKRWPGELYGDFKNEDFNTSATIPSKMKKYGGEEVGKTNLDDSVPTPATPVTAKTPASFPLYDVTGIAQMLKDQVKKEGGGKAGVAKVALKYGVPAALLTKWLLADEDEKRDMLKNNPALRRLGT